MNLVLVAIAWKSLINRGMSAALTILAVTLAVTLFLSVERIQAGVRTSFNSTISGTDIIVGARGGAINLLLYSVFRLGDPTANVSWESFERIAQAPGVDWAVPISLGDSHRGYRVVGTTPEYFQRYRYGRDLPLSFRQGRAFERTHEVVLGSDVARRLDYEIGTQILLSHGVGAVSFAEHGGHDFAVIGVLEPTGTPVDRSVHVSLESIEAIHIGWDGGIAPRNPTIATDDDALRPESVTAAFIGTVSPMRVLSLQRQINSDPDEALSAVMPGVALTQLWQIIGVGEQAFRAVSALVLLVGLISILTALTSGLNERRREMAVLRATGARPADVFSLLVLEASGLAAIGALVGILLTQLAVAIVASLMQSRFGLDLHGSPGSLELGVFFTVTFAGAAAGTLPAWQAQRNVLSDGLTNKL
ncbi:MAG: ABC transporter permease [Maricaulis sp.]|jgi:putative ABC transport system permease protein|nr:ABC transporter permease [Maricaulis sp.]MDG2045164.1 ABC transporter permease [Maricaulis sp.]